MRIGVGLAITQPRAAGGGATVPPSLTGGIAASTIIEGAGTQTITTSGAFAGSPLTYSLRETWTGRAPPGMTINPATGVITCDRAALRRGLRYLRVTASNGLGSAVLDFNVFVRRAAADYIVTTVGEWDTTVALPAATLAGKVIAVNADLQGPLTLPPKSPASPIIITTWSHAARIGQIVTGTGAGGGPWLVDGAVLNRTAYPSSASLVRAAASSGETIINFIDCDFGHNYRGGILDPAAALDEYNKGALQALTATTTSAATALGHRDAAMPNGWVTVTNNGSQTIYARLGNSGVVATVSDTAVAAGATTTISFSTTLPTHIALLSASGSQSVSVQSEQGLFNYVAGAFSQAGGGAKLVSTIRRCTFHDLDNAVKGIDATVVDDCDIFRVFQDAVSISAKTDGAFTYVTRNRIGLPFGRASYAQNPHSDVGQFSSENATQPGRNFIHAGNIVFLQFAGQDNRAQGLFASDHPGGYYDCVVIGNANLSSNNNGYYIGEPATSDPAVACMMWGNTAFYGPNADLTAWLQMQTYGLHPNFNDRNIGTAFTGGMVGPNNSTVSAANLTTLIPALTSLQAARTAYDALPHYGSLGAGYAWAQGAIQWDAADETGMDNWNVVPPGIIFNPISGVPTSSVQTTPWRKVIGGGGAVVPLAGTEWQSSSDGGTTIVQDWTTGSGTIARGHSIRKRSTSSANPTTTTNMGFTINGVATNTTVTTSIVTPTVFWTVGAGTPVTYLRDTLNMAAGTTRLVGKAKIYMPTDPGIIFSLFNQATSAWRLEVSASRQMTVSARDSANAVVLAGSTVLDASNNPVVLPVAEWLDITFDVNHTAQTVQVTINGVAHPAIAFTTAGSGTHRVSVPILIGSATGAGSSLWPAGLQVADVSVERNGSAYKTIPNAAASVNADAWKQGANAT